VILDLVAALTATMLLVLVGYPWSRVLVETHDRMERAAYAMALALAMTPIAARVLLGVTGGGLGRGVAILSLLAVGTSGLVILAWSRRRAGSISSPADGPRPEDPSSPSRGSPLLAWRPRPSLDITAFRYRLTDPGAHTRLVTAALVLAILTVGLLRAYLGPVLFDWPFIRGEDQYEHAIRTRAVLVSGSNEGDQVYPAGFHVLSAVLARLSNLRPDRLYVVLAPILTILPAFGAYVLARRALGPSYALGALALASLLLVPQHHYFGQGTYPQILAGQFLVPMALASAILLRQKPASGHGASLAVLIAATAHFHTLATVYLVVALACLGVGIAPVVRSHQRAIRSLAVAVIAGALLALGLVWDSYDVPGTLAGLIGLSGGSPTLETTASVIGNRRPIPLVGLPERVPTIVFVLGAAGVVLALLGLVRGRARDPVGLIALVMWVIAFLILGRLPESGFPARFGRDIAIPLVVLASLALAAALEAFQGMTIRRLAMRGALAVLVLAGAVAALGAAARPGLMILTPDLQAATRWLEGRSPDRAVITNPMINRAVEALSGHDVLPTLTAGQLHSARGVTASVIQKVSDVRHVYGHPGSARAERILARYEVGYILLAKRMPPRAPLRRQAYVDWQRFADWPAQYRLVYENPEVIIFEVIGAER
jgi:hypothetical protein